MQIISFSIGCHGYSLKKERFCSQEVNLCISEKLVQTESQLEEVEEKLNTALKQNEAFRNQVFIPEPTKKKHSTTHSFVSTLKSSLTASLRCPNPTNKEFLL